MMVNQVSEILLFADIDCAPQCAETSKEIVIGFAQNGEDVRIKIAKNTGKIVEVREGAERKYSSYKGLLSSANFGNLKRFVDAQRALIQRDAPYILEDPERHLPVVGQLEAGDATGEASGLIESVDRWLQPDLDRPGIKALVVDGPAGIGKTHLVRALSFKRASNFGPGSGPPILHVQSRGRKLTGLPDVIAGTLQAMRLPLTFDQIPVLVRHGLMQVAIDGFDELADPSGYQTAWGALRDFIEEIKGNAGLILAGRDTFINISSVKKSLPALDTQNTGAVHLRPLREHEALGWLERQAWSAAKMNDLRSAELFVEGGYAMRPFFMAQIAKFVADDNDFSALLAYPLHSLVTTLVEREAKLLEPAIASIDAVRIVELLRKFFEELAREMLDAEAESVDEATAVLLAEMVFSPIVSTEEMSVIRHRVAAFAMLEQDVSPGKRRFPHTEIKDYFSGWNLLKIIGSGEVSKAVRRNILGSDFLETFHDIAALAGAQELESFLDQSLIAIRGGLTSDRTRPNLTSLVLSALTEPLPGNLDVELTDMTLDEAILRERVPAIRIARVGIGQLDLRGADMSQVLITDSQVGTVVGDATTVLPPQFPVPGVLVVEHEGRARPIVDQREVGKWLAEHTQPDRTDAPPSSEHLAFVEKLCRTVLRQNWLVISGTSDDRAYKLLEDERWPRVRDILEERGFLKYKFGQGVSGPRADFVTILRAFSFVAPEERDPEVEEAKQAIRMLG